MSSPPEPRARPGGDRLAAAARWLSTPEFSVVVVIGALAAYLLAVGRFGQFNSEFNRDSISRSVSLQSIFAIGELLVILTGGIDLSLGSLIAFAGMLLAWVMRHLVEGGLPATGVLWFGAGGCLLPLAWLAPTLFARRQAGEPLLPVLRIGLVAAAMCGLALRELARAMVRGGCDATVATLIGAGVVLAFSLGLGLLHATLVHQLRLPPFVVTLASMSVLRSAALLLNNAVPIPIDGFPLIRFLGNGKVYLAGTPAGVTVSTLIMLLLAAASTLLLLRTPLGRRIYGLGSNEEAARLSGVNTFRVRLFVYGGCSLLGGLAGILYAGYSAQGDPSSGTMFELNAISAAVIGGAVLTGGRGSVMGTVLGATLLEWILSIINLTLSNPTLWRGTVVGAVLTLAVVINQTRILRQRR